MTDQNNFDVIIVGGGLAGLVSAIVLAANKKKVLILEKKTYPAHKVCGEYVSNEVLRYLQSLGFDPFSHDAANISKLRISSPSGKNIYTGLDLGAFALSRYVMDDELAKLAVKSGAVLLTQTTVTSILFKDKSFTVNIKDSNTYTSDFVIGSWGKRDLLDKKMNRPFIENHTRYMGVKYHIRTDYPVNEIGLDNFEGGYCGIVKIEADKYNLCNFYRRPKATERHKSVQSYEEEVVFKNPVIKSIFKNSEFLFDAPVVINEVSFAPKSPVEDHILMCGDSAGLITPLCGNGMSMAITGAKLLTDILLNSGLPGKKIISDEERESLENMWRRTWVKHFRQRLSVGRAIQGLFGNPILTEISLRVLHAIPLLERTIIKRTHGEVL